MNVLIYWNNNKLVYPALATIAQHVLCIPVANTSVERLFSDSGNTITIRRTRLKTSKVIHEPASVDQMPVRPDIVVGLDDVFSRLKCRIIKPGNDSKSILSLMFPGSAIALIINSSYVGERLMDNSSCRFK
ncbi:unnamed protein product [Rotaria magnacalcarata]|uniref:HAT C-terminal dimerisation domain-containing protein n=1 Tax=Rotaria magnacalcarata TaxID=392030 RepID=A0A820K920_9BILA|nr:unnamed protein product [Rotaria magnacalcarata]CAF4333427.1 unnamed protein product [Rotaria magnacalcarata]